jgi:hypothetical protein
MKKRIAALAALAAFASSLACASSTAIDYTDLWFNPAEPGWGLNVIHQGDTLFASLFVYDTGSQPTWYFASSATQAGTTSTFTGTLSRSNGAFFGGPFGGLSVATVGTFAFAASGVNSATLTYNVNGTTVTKQLQRDSFKGDNIAGTYIGGSTGTWSGCTAARNGYVEAGATYSVSHDGTSVQIREEGAGFQCNYTGTYTQQGRFGAIAGGGVCTDGINQTLNATEVQVSRDALTMHVVDAQIGGGCVFNGRLGGLRRGS